MLFFLWAVVMVIFFGCTACSFGDISCGDICPLLIEDPETFKGHSSLLHALWQEI